MYHSLKKIGILGVSFAVAVVLVISITSWGLRADKVNAGVNDNVTGFAWSDMPVTSNEVSNAAAGTVGRGAGWISFNNSDIPGSTIEYGVSVNAAGIVSGTAWSEHVGWISFNASAGCPTNNGTNCQPRIETVGGTKVFRGWARALAHTDPQAGGWDGWISFSSANHTGGISYGWTVDTMGNVSGYAWGGDVLGWIVPQGLVIDDVIPTLQLTANPATISSANPLVTDLTYQVGNWLGTDSPFSSCAFTTNPTTGSSTDGTPVHGTTLTTAATLPVTANRTITNVRVYNPANHQTVYTLTCTPTAGGPTITASATVTVTDPVPSAQLTAPACVTTAGNSAQLIWNTANVTACSISPSIGSVGLNSNQAVSINGTVTYTLSCTGPYGPASAARTITVNANCQTTGPGGPIIPIFEEI